MKPVLIFEHIENGGPGLFREFLARHAVPSVSLRPDLGEPVPDPAQLVNYSGLCFCGGTQSVTRPEAWMLQELELIRAAADRQLPVIGHCLGGQLISAALGGEVVRQPETEFGWSRLTACANAHSARWLGDECGDLVAMQWHEDTFSVPPGATPLLRGEVCENQAFASGPMLAMQFHIELDRSLIRYWAVQLGDKHPAPGTGRQTGQEILSQLEGHYAISSRLARQLYGVWLAAIG